MQERAKGASVINRFDRKKNKKAKFAKVAKGSTGHYVVSSSSQAMNAGKNANAPYPESQNYVPTTSSLADQTQSQHDPNLTSDQFAQEINSSHSSNFSGLDTPSKHNSSMRANDFSFNSGKNFYPQNLAKLIPRQSPSPSRAADGRIQGPFLNKNVSQPVQGFDAFIRQDGTRGRQPFYSNDTTMKLGIRGKLVSESVTGSNP